MRVLSIGECMVELSQAPEAGGLWRQGFAGDTLNTAWYLRALLPAATDVDYMTVLGTDAISEEMLGFFAANGIGTGCIARHPQRVPGLYMISLRDGERSFTYWRDRSAARCLADDAVALDTALAAADLVYLSGVTAAILEPEARARLREALARRRAAGARIVFDPNLRPRLWPSAGVMAEEITRMAAVADIVLPSHDDEAGLFGDADPAATARRYLANGAGEVVVKNGGGEMVVALAGASPEVVAPGPAIRPVDTTGAGDSFNGGYLSARLEGLDPAAAVARGHRLALAVVGRHGALIPMEDARATLG